MAESYSRPIIQSINIRLTRQNISSDATPVSDAAAAAAALDGEMVTDPFRARSPTSGVAVRGECTAIGLAAVASRLDGQAAPSCKVARHIDRRLLAGTHERRPALS